MSDYIEVGQSLQFTDPNTPTRVGEIVENVSDIYNIPSPRLGMQVFVKSEKKSFVITSLKSKFVGGVDVPEAAVDAFEPVGAKSITWKNNNNPSNMNDFVVAGVYDIKGEHTRMDDNLPILNIGGGHSFNARLTVLDSSITGSGENDDKCITQVLSLSNRLGQGEVYIRTGKGSSLNNLTWENWSTLQRNVNVGEVGSLDDLKENGIYSGVWLFGSFNAYPLTFVCIVINDYFIGIAPRRISQFVYGLSKLNGSVVYQSRVWDDSNDKWGDWEILNQKEISSMIYAEIEQTEADAIEKGRQLALRSLFVAAGAEYNDTNANKAKTAPWGETVQHLPKHYYLNGLGDITEEQMTEIYNAGRMMQGVAGFYNSNDKIRTNLPSLHSTDSGYSKNFEGRGMFLACKMLEVAIISKKNDLSDRITANSNDAQHVFFNCSKLRYVSKLSLEGGTSTTNMFRSCSSLSHVEINKLETNLSFSDSPLIDKESILHLIQNNKAKSAITITLHADAYNRLANDADIIAALEAQPLVTLVSA